MSVLTLILLGTGCVATLMLVLWLIHLRTGNAAIVDAGWAGGLAILGALYAALGGGYWVRSALLAAMSAIWGLRLAIYLLTTRVIGHPEEGRYQELRRQWKTNIPAKFLAFFEFQALLDVVLALPFLLAARNPQPGISALEWIAVALWIVAMAGEAAADAQLSKFKSDSANRGRTCRAGLWNYSRHPNYFFEWLIWMAFALFALGSPYGYWGLLSPALILYFVLRVTGIPATEAQALRTRGEEYRRYQETTSAFVPWFPKTLPKTSADTAL
jgi:steroid 5-alpha reductase family enzyme